MKPIRRPVTHRNYLSPGDYSGEYLPRYVHGSGIVLSLDVVRYLVCRADTSRHTGAYSVLQWG